MAPLPDARLHNVLARSAALREVSAEALAEAEALRQRSRFIHRRFVRLYGRSSDLLMRGFFRRYLPQLPQPKCPLRLLA